MAEQTTEDRIREIAQGFGEGFQNYRQGQQVQRNQDLQAEALKRQRAMQALDVSNSIATQTGKRVDPNQIGAMIDSGNLQGISALMESAPTTKKFDAEQAQLKRQVDKDLRDQEEAQYKADQRAKPVTERDDYLKAAAVKSIKGAPKKGVTEHGVQLKPNEVDKFNEGNQIPTMLADVSKVIDDNAGEFGPIKGRLGALNPYNEKAQTIESSMRTAAQSFGKFMEGGMLRAEDEIKYRKMFPSQEDTPEVAKNKLALVNRLLVNKQNSTVGALKQAGYDVSPIDKKLMESAQPKVLQNNSVNMDAIKSTSREEKIRFLLGGNA